MVLESPKVLLRSYGHGLLGMHFVWGPVCKSVARVQQALAVMGSVTSMKGAKVYRLARSRKCSDSYSPLAYSSTGLAGTAKAQKGRESERQNNRRAPGGLRPRGIPFQCAPGHPSLNAAAAKQRQLGTCQNALCNRFPSIIPAPVATSSGYLNS